MIDVSPLREEVWLLKNSAVTDGEKMARLEIKAGELYCAAVKYKTVNEVLETSLAAAGSRLFGSLSELSGSRNKLDEVRHEIAYIRRDAEDAAANDRTDLKKSH